MLHKPRKKAYLAACFGILLVTTYILVILFTMIVKKQKEFSETLERFRIPTTEEKIAIQNLPEIVHRKEKVELTKILGNAVTDASQAEGRWNDFNLPFTNKDSNFSRNQVQIETNVQVVIYPNKTQTHFAVFGLTTPGYEDYFYAFSAPLAVRSWRRIGYSCIVFIIGDMNEWMARETLKHILSELISLKPAIVFLKYRPENDVLLSQACRLFASNFFSWEQPNTTYLITSDVDLWPVNSALFDIREGKRVKSLNSECCGSFNHGSHIYKLLPLGNIIADISVWKQIINVQGFYPKTGYEIIDYFFRVFGPLALERTRKEEYVGWYMDQRMISMRLSEWMDKHGGSNVEFVPRDPGRDRIDVNNWVPYSLYGKNDIHILSGVYKPGVWEKIRPLLKLLFSEGEEYQIVQYREIFMKLYIDSRKNT